MPNLNTCAILQNTGVNAAFLSEIALAGSLFLDSTMNSADSVCGISALDVLPGRGNNFCSLEIAIN